MINRDFLHLKLDEIRSFNDSEAVIWIECINENDIYLFDLWPTPYDPSHAIRDYDLAVDYKLDQILP